MSQDKLKERVISLIKESNKCMIDNLDKVLSSGKVDTEDCDTDNPMLLPKAILIALLKEETNQYNGKGTSFEDYIEEESDNIYSCI